ncbi:MerR family transcriptional regulator, glutamine synthetase repressor [Seinonella peptonophila]|uniref:MerR family transcriptional regulator, glutamine synthetase repressor n=1 Tax=Seinonella peptonophila TaxID=112248 RepID=A0A1M4T1K1_9BACL|nr:MerR family transcriptional regulator [Seinonella peptonophila]SHE38331.1 MerR family transcriptional regulator, glutamine synthetase repressor [Seinonella peptonophila]
MRDDIRRNMPLLPMRIVTKLTELTPRQIRYYEQQGLVNPARTDGRQRLFSFNDVDLLLKIKSWLEKGLNIAGVRQMLGEAQQVLETKKDQTKKATKELSERELRKLLKRQLTAGPTRRVGETHLTYGELTRFFRH